MTETSFFWDGLVTGDASLAPYTNNLYHKIWQILFTRSDNEGVFKNILNQLVVNGISGGVTVKSGMALVDGTFYENDSTVSFNIPSPSSNPRADRVVIRKSWAAEEIRAAFIQNLNEVTTPPALTQVDLSIWEIPLARTSITTAGVITIVDEREFVDTRLASGSGMFEISRFVATGDETQIVFQNIPSNFNHLIIRGNILTGPLVASVFSNIYFNGDTTATNYRRQTVSVNVPPTIGAGASNLQNFLNTIGLTQIDKLHNTQFDMFIPNYRNTTFFKTATQKESTDFNSVAADMVTGIEYNLWENTDAIDEVSIIPPSGGTIEIGTSISLYGLQ